MTQKKQKKHYNCLRPWHDFLRPYF